MAGARIRSLRVFEKFFDALPDLGGSCLERIVVNKDGSVGGQKIENAGNAALFKRIGQTAHAAVDLRADGVAEFGDEREVTCWEEARSVIKQGG